LDQTIHPFLSHAHSAEMAEPEMGEQIAILVATMGFIVIFKGNEIDDYDR
jgi:hypothetical protein